MNADTEDDKWELSGYETTRKRNYIISNITTLVRVMIILIVQMNSPRRTELNPL